MAPSADSSAATDKRLHEWIPRYRRWAHDVYKDSRTDTPTRQQRHVLLTVHYRAVTEEYELAGEQVPEEIFRDAPPNCDVNKPLLRLVHGLPGSGKSMLIQWVKRYFEEVWLWTRNKQYAVLAPMNTTADNIGGPTIHSVGRIPFKDWKGMMIQTGTDKTSSGSFVTDEEWPRTAVPSVR